MVRPTNPSSWVLPQMRSGHYRRFRRWATAGDELECHSPPPDSPSIAIWTTALCSEGRSYPPIHTERRQTHPAPGGPESTEAARTLPAGAFHTFTWADHGRWSGHMDLEATARCFDCCPADDIWLCTEVKDDRSCIDNIDLKDKAIHLLSHCENQNNIWKVYGTDCRAHKPYILSILEYCILKMQPTSHINSHS